MRLRNRQTSAADARNRHICPYTPVPPHRPQPPGDCSLRWFTALRPTQPFFYRSSKPFWRRAHRRLRLHSVAPLSWAAPPWRYPHDPHRWLAAEPVPDPLPWPAAHGRLTPIAQPTARGSLRAARKQRCDTALCARAVAQSLGRRAYPARQLAGRVRSPGISGDASTATVMHCQDPTPITKGTPAA